jgi:hypothetical protein
MASDLIKEVSNHIEFLGYKVTKDDEVTYAAEPVMEDQAKPSFTFHPAKGGLFFLSGYPLSKEANADPIGFFEFLNEGNVAAYLVRFTWSRETEGFYAEGYFPGTYDKHAFATFITTWLEEIVKFITSNKPRVKKYFQIAPRAE